MPRGPVCLPPQRRARPRGVRVGAAAARRRLAAPRSKTGQEQVGVTAGRLVHLHSFGARFFYVFYLKLHFAASMSPGKLALSLGSRSGCPLLCSFWDGGDLLTPPLPPSPWAGSSGFTPGTPEPGHVLRQRREVGGGGGRSQASRQLPGQRSTWSRARQAAHTILGLSWQVRVTWTLEPHLHARNMLHGR